MSNAGRWRIVATSLLAIAAAFALILDAYYEIFRNMSCYDDEGYMLIQIRHFLNGRALYDDIVTPYGPTYFLLVRLAFGVLPFGHDGIRLLTLGSLGLASALCALCVLGLTRRAELSVLAGLLTGLKLVRPFAAEPGHPQIVVTILVAAIAAIMAWWNPRRPVAMAGLVGVLVAALGMTKINVGAYAAISLFMAFLLASDESSWLVRFLRNWVILAAVALPFALIRSRLATRFGAGQAVFYVVPICAVLLTAIGASAPARDRRLGTPPIVSYLLGGAVATIALCAFALVCGTTSRGVISGIILMPLQMMSAFGQGPLTSDSRPEAALSLLIAVFYFLALRRGLQFSSVAVAVLKLIFAATVIAPVLLGRSTALQGWGLFLWIVLVPLPESEGEAARGDETGRVDLSRLSLVLLAALQPLQSYPVAGSQVAIGTMLMVSAAIVCLADLLAWARFRAGVASAAAWALQAVGPATTVALLAFMVVRVAQEKSAYDQSVPLGIHESSRLRLPERQVAGIRWLVANINHSCDTFLCPTGFHSLYLWTDKEPPSRIVLGHVLSLFTQSEQQALLDSIEAAPHPLIVDHAGLFSGLEAKDVPGAHKSPLLDGIARDFVPYGGGSVEGFTLRSRVGQATPQMVECATWTDPENDRTRSAVLDLLPKQGRAVDRVCVVVIGGKSIGSLAVDVTPDRFLADTRSDGTGAVLEILDESGAKAAWPLILDVRRRFVLKFSIPPGTSLEPLTVVRLLDRDGQAIASVPFLTPFRPPGASGSQAARQTDPQKALGGRDRPQGGNN